MNVPSASAAPTSPSLNDERPTITGYRDPQTLGRVVRFLLIGHAVLSVAMALSSAMEIALLQRIDAGHSVTAEAAANDARQGLLALIYLLFLLAGAVVVAMWMNRSNKNIRALNAGPLTHGPNAWGWFFCPFINLVRPFQVMRELFVSSKAYDDKTLGVIFPLWWGMWLASNVAGQIELRMDTETINAMIIADGVGIVGAIATGISALALRRIVGEVVEAQQSCAREATRAVEPGAANA